jgi:polar amino acid transport system substrate-binding protein
LALRDGRCVGWAFDDTVIARLLAGPDWPGYRMAMPTILEAPWSLAVRSGEGDATLGRFAADMVADWHKSGRLEALQAKWGLPPSGFLAAQRQLWSRSEGGAPVCRRGAGGGYPPACTGEAVAAAAADRPGDRWTAAVRAATGLDLAPLLDPLNQSRLVRGIWTTLALSLAAIVGSLGVGAAIAVADHSLGRGAAARALRLPLRGLVAAARMTPPLLQLYILFFGLGGLLASRTGVTPGGFAVAAVVLSLYAGATNAVLLGGALAQMCRERPGAGATALLPAAVERCYEGLVSTSVNIVKAAGLASTIAVPEAISAVQTIIAEGADAASMMTLLLVFYFVFVLAVLGLLRAAKGALTWAA